MNEDREDRDDDKSTAVTVAQGQVLMEADAKVARQQAKAFPRQEDKILKGALAELDLVPEMAAKAYYSIPFVDRKTNKTNLVQGLSIGSAISLARRWGNCATTVRCIGDDDGGWDLEGIFIDFETNFHCGRPGRGSKLGRSGAKVYLLDERRQAMAFGAAASKAQRNAALAGLPTYLKEAYFAKARQLAGGDPDTPADPKRVVACIKAFAKLGVTQEQIENNVGKPSAEWSGDDVANLRGLWNAINDENITVAEAFGASKEGEAPQAPGVVTPDSLSGAAVTAENDPKRPAPIPAPEVAEAIESIESDLARKKQAQPVIAGVIVPGTGQANKAGATISKEKPTESVDPEDADVASLFD